MAVALEVAKEQKTLLQVAVKHRREPVAYTLTKRRAAWHCLHHIQQDERAKEDRAKAIR